VPISVCNHSDFSIRIQFMGYCLWETSVLLGAAFLYSHDTKKHQCSNQAPSRQCHGNLSFLPPWTVERDCHSRSSVHRSSLPSRSSHNGFMGTRTNSWKVRDVAVFEVLFPSPFSHWVLILFF
jgi:hypothetical protein